jgi:hypothetical protein
MGAAIGAGFKELLTLRFEPVASRDVPNRRFDVYVQQQVACKSGFFRPVQTMRSGMFSPAASFSI